MILNQKNDFPKGKRYERKVTKYNNKNNLDVMNDRNTSKIADGDDW